MNDHLQTLIDAELDAVVDASYSQKGIEMSVYGPVSEPFVLIAGASDDPEAVRRAVAEKGTNDATAPGD